MTLHVMYRLVPTENNKRRPLYHSKTLCLKSALVSLAGVPGSRFVLLVDDDSLPGQFADLLPSGILGEQMLLGGIGNSPSFLRQLDLAQQLPSDHMVFFAEDDYLYRPDSFASLVAAMQALPAVDYFTLYDHPDRYHRTDDATLPSGKAVWLAGDRHWRRVESTCMTFGARAGTLQQDRALLARAARGQHPKDRRMWRRLQSIGAYRWTRSRRVLASPIPSLSTHMDTSFLAPAVDWQSVAASVDGV